MRGRLDTLAHAGPVGARGRLFGTALAMTGATLPGKPAPARAMAADLLPGVPARSRPPWRRPFGGRAAAAR